VADRQAKDTSQAKKRKQKLKRLQLVVSRLPRNTTIHRKTPLFSLTKRKRNAL
jgi:hypothetical protein